MHKPLSDNLRTSVTPASNPQTVRPNPALQSDPRLWRSTRSLAFWQIDAISNAVLWRGRLNAKPLGQHHQRSSHFSVLLGLSVLLFSVASILLDLAPTVDYTVGQYPQYEVVREDYPNDD
jgi:hypothetical protein